MAGSAATTERVNWALEQLMAGRGSTAVVTEMSERWGLSRRQAQRITAKAHQTMVSNLDQTERTHLTAQLVHLLMGEPWANALTCGVCCQALMSTAVEVGVADF